MFLLDQTRGIEIFWSSFHHFGNQVENKLVSFEQKCDMFKNLFEFFFKLGKKSSRIIFDSILPSRAVYPINFKVQMRSSPSISEIEFQNAMITFSVNPENCQFEANSTEKVVVCQSGVKKNSTSLLRVADFWFKLPQPVVIAGKCVT
jgi:hypothetical protein